MKRWVTEFDNRCLYEGVGSCHFGAVGSQSTRSLDDLYQALIMYNMVALNLSSSLLLTTRPMLVDLVTWYERAVKTPVLGSAGGPIPLRPTPPDGKQDGN